MSDRDVLKELCGADSLPTLPEAVTRILGEIDADEVEMARVADLVAQDPALTGQILRMANSVLFNASGLSTPSIHEAVGRIGLRGVRNLVVSIGVVEAFEKPAGLDFREFWRHSFSSAVAAGSLAHQLPGFQAAGSPRDNPYFLAGLLHDVGTLLFCQELGDEFSQLVAEALERDVLLHELERDRLGADHQQAGAALIRRWGLPFEVVAAAEHHHDVARAPEDARDYVMLVAAADAILGRNGRCSPAELHPDDDARLATLGLEASGLMDLTGEVMAAAESSDALLSVALTS